MNRVGVVVAVVVAAVLLILGVVVAADDSDDAGSAAAAHLTDMQTSAATLRAGGEAMQRHGQQMLDDGRATGDQDLIRLGEHWLADGRQLVQRGEWLAMTPTHPGSLLVSPTELRASGSWAELTRRTREMVHDPSGAREIDIEALRLNGAAMQAEGRLMTEHGRQMADEVALLVALHGLDAAAADELRASTAAMERTGAGLEANGNAMVDYADQIARSIGK